MSTHEHLALPFYGITHNGALSSGAEETFRRWAFCLARHRRAAADLLGNPVREVKAAFGLAFATVMAFQLAAQAAEVENATRRWLGGQLFKRTNDRNKAPHDMGPPLAKRVRTQRSHTSGVMGNAPNAGPAPLIRGAEDGVPQRHSLQGQLGTGTGNATNGVLGQGATERALQQLSQRSDLDPAEPV